MTIPIDGMHCKSCELSIEEKIKKIEHVAKVDVSHVSGKAKIWFLSKKPAMSDIATAVTEAGYSLATAPSNKGWISRDPMTYFYVACAAAILAFLYAFANGTGLTGFADSVTTQSIGTAPLIGLVAGLSSCMALIGGLVLGLSANHAESHPEATRLQKFRPHLYFNLGRILGFAILGGLIGLVGGFLQPSFRLMAIFTLLVGAAMVLLGIKLTEIFPVLDRVNITLPKFITRLVGAHKQSQEYSHNGAFLGGVASFFLPCGFTQAMQLYAISTGSFTEGALIMSLFAVGTSVGLLGIGGLASSFQNKAKLFFATAGLAVIALGIFNMNNSGRIVLAGSGSAPTIATSLETQELNAQFWARPLPDMEPSNFTVKVNQPVKMKVYANTDGIGCMSSILIPGLFNTPQYFSEGDTVTMKFTPTKTGSYPITCAMGVKRGTLTVAE